LAHRKARTGKGQGKAKDKAMSENAANADTFQHRAAIFVVAAVVGGILAGTVALWAHYGTAIFFETIRAGLVACFG
jgi:hypothetical protein